MQLRENKRGGGSRVVVLVLIADQSTGDSAVGQDRERLAWCFLSSSWACCPWFSISYFYTYICFGGGACRQGYCSAAMSVRAEAGSEELHGVWGVCCLREIVGRSRPGVS